VITGFNTDIPYNGTTYHVQTEDKGLETPLILSLVYVGGAIIASKRTYYTDLVESGFDEKTLAERLQRQHKLICAAIRAGRIDDLKKMGGEKDAARPATEAAEAAPDAPPQAPTAPAQTPVAPPPARVATPTKVVTPTKAAPPTKPAPPAQAAPPPAQATPPATPKPEPKAPEPVRKPEPEPEFEFIYTGPFDIIRPDPSIVKDAPPLEPVEHVRAEPPPPPPPAPAPPEAEAGEETSAEGEGELYLNLVDDEGDFRAGQLATIKIHVGRGKYGRQAVADAAVSVRVLGTSFRPLILTTQTDLDGYAVVRALLPRFTSGRAAIIIRAVADGDVAELRRIIHQA